jgi:hypothetical protein
VLYGYGGIAMKSKRDEIWRNAKKYDEVVDTHEWMDKIPFIKFNPEWEVKAIPPYSGAIIRYIVKKGDNTVSIYLDGYDILGYVGEPYWEIYPYENDVFRCMMNETDLLIQAIADSFEDMESEVLP